MFCICFHFIELFYKFFSEIHTKTIHFLYNSWWTHQERRNFDCWNRRKSELAKRWECDKKSFNHDRFIGNCKVNNLVKGSESKHVDGGAWVTYGKQVDFPPLPMCSGSSFPCLPFLCVLLPYLRHSPGHSRSFLALKLCFSTSPRYKHWPTYLAASSATYRLHPLLGKQSEGEKQTVVNRCIKGWSTIPSTYEEQFMLSSAALAHSSLRDVFNW